MSGKDALKKFIPPIFFELRSRCKRYRTAYLSTREFIKWWTDFRLSPLPDELIAMVDHYVSTPSFRETSYMWNFLSKEHIELLGRYKIDNFKQTIERHHYWGEAKVDSRLIAPLLSSPITVDVKTEELFRTHEFCTMADSLQHNAANIILLNYIVNNGYGKYLETLEEPLFGNPIFIRYDQKRVSFPLLNSIIEIDAIFKHIAPKPKARFLEIGAGSAEPLYPY